MICWPKMIICFLGFSILFFVSESRAVEPTIVNETESQYQENSAWDDLKSLPGWIWNTEKAVFQESSVRLCCAATAATGLSYIFDDQIDHSLKKNKPFQKPARALDIGGRFAYSLAWAGFYFGGKLFDNPNLVKTGKAILITNISANLIGTALWFTLGRRRPDMAKNRHDFDPFNVNNLKATIPPFKIQPSFPSLHTVGLSSIAVVVTKFHGWKYGLPVYATTALVGFARMAREGHFLSDVVAGGFLGTMTGLAVCEIMDTLQMHNRNSIAIGPQFSKEQGGIFLTINIRLRL